MFSEVKIILKKEEKLPSPLSQGNFPVKGGQMIQIAEFLSQKLTLLISKQKELQEQSLTGMGYILILI